MADPSAPADLPEREPSGDGELLPAPLRAWMRLLAAAGAIEQQLRSRVKDTLDVSHDEFLVLCLLADQPGSGLRMTQIAELLGRPKTRLTYQVACLQHAGLITRRSACGDRRGIEVVLTDKARRLLRESTGPLADAVSQAIAQTACAQRYEALHDLLPPSPHPGADSREVEGGDTAPEGPEK
ncbi:MarR family winged helix-turn-helix transcriptional regulator [Streptomyces mirabilis]|uniref:MarR family winged helix-turn-helix transcriptional regulator n=1 Tax=Streptomyces mirabilis TaxID=68239 RepID=UPI00099EB726|nr:MarR family transcriptional regulator [Streptomyces mirabilis]MCX4419910.1 MarR family transcriptional regulator [Streptomyces mirabilis]